MHITSSVKVGLRAGRCRAVHGGAAWRADLGRDDDPIKERFLDQWPWALILLLNYVKFIPSIEETQIQ